MVDHGGALPAGLTLNGSTGAITGTPTTAGTANFHCASAGLGGHAADGIEGVCADDQSGRRWRLVRRVHCRQGQLEQVYSQTVAATGGTAPYAWSITVGALPAGLTLNGSTGAITGTPTTAGTANFTLQAQDSAGTPQTASKAFALTINPATLTISTASPLHGRNCGNGVFSNGRCDRRHAALLRGRSRRGRCRLV